MNKDNQEKFARLLALSKVREAHDILADVLKRI